MKRGITSQKIAGVEKERKRERGREGPDIREDIVKNVSECEERKSPR